LIDVFQDDICDLKRYQNSSFGLVLAIGAPFSYCTNAHVALSEIHRVTIDSGFLVGDVENRFYGAHDARRARTWEDAKRILLDGIAYWPNAVPPYPITEFSTSQLKELLEQTNWHLEKLYPTNLKETLLPKHILHSVLSNENGIKEIIDLETKLREDASLLSCGFDLQFVVKKTG
jgi:SAM-dependent methyltransferase